MKLRVGLIGLGNSWENIHGPALRALSDRFQVRAVCCEIAQRAEMVAREFDAVQVDGFRSMLNLEDVDAILALAPDWVGPLPILAACEAGKAVYASAALDIAPEQAQAIKRRVEGSGVAFMAELPRRHAPATLRLKELIATRLGQPQLLFCHERMSSESRVETHRGGVQCPSAIKSFMELVDWCRYVIGTDPYSVMAVRHEHEIAETDSDYQFLNLEFPKTESSSQGAIAQISIGHYVPQQWTEALSFRRPASLQVCCENGIAFLDLPNNIVWFDDAGQHSESLESDRPVGEQLLNHFHRAVTSLVRKTSDLEDAYRAMTVVQAAATSIQKQKRIELKVVKNTEE